MAVAVVTSGCGTFSGMMGHPPTKKARATASGAASAQASGGASAAGTVLSAAAVDALVLAVQEAVVAAGTLSWQYSVADSSASASSGLTVDGRGRCAPQPEYTLHATFTRSTATDAKIPTDVVLLDGTGWARVLNRTKDGTVWVRIPDAPADETAALWRTALRSYARMACLENVADTLRLGTVTDVGTTTVDRREVETYEVVLDAKGARSLLARAAGVDDTDVPEQDAGLAATVVVEASTSRVVRMETRPDGAGPRRTVTYDDWGAEVQVEAPTDVVPRDRAIA